MSQTKSPLGDIKTGSWNSVEPQAVAPLGLQPYLAGLVRLKRLLEVRLEANEAALEKLRRGNKGGR